MEIEHGQNKEKKLLLIISAISPKSVVEFFEMKRITSKPFTNRRNNLMETKFKSIRKVPAGSPLFPDRPRLSQEEIARLKTEDEVFGQRCRAIFDQVAPQLMPDHYGWSIHIEPDSGDYFIDPDPQVAFQKAKQKHPNAILLEMCLNETGACGRV
jgi:hypothetical protein